MPQSPKLQGDVLPSLETTIAVWESAKPCKARSVDRVFKYLISSLLEWQDWVRDSRASQESQVCENSASSAPYMDRGLIGLNVSLLMG